ncbi:Oidioi.mRNA.OKI2018_I69.PAR.g11638.t2.cds [Oikopleura dioica]|uniref:Oidioi.mRNA.OKI2018_I69.PAR.g11638.t2.cds n=1 Tax=Oikopleura dioica TaxID=34765 RepID=A0ABN7RZX7_OIKDI|nr:Oidioi.mRNA.OKI2018_I69.PAR.g11638.t2.cds [Oikopleura dioica]
MSNFIRDKPLRKTAAEGYENDSDREFIADSSDDKDDDSQSDSELGSDSSDAVERMNREEYKRSTRKVTRRGRVKKEIESEITSASSSDEITIKKKRKVMSSSSDEEAPPPVDAPPKPAPKRSKRKRNLSSSEEEANEQNSADSSEDATKATPLRRSRRKTRQNRVRKVFVSVDSDDDKPSTQNLASSGEEPEKPTNTKTVPVETPMCEDQYSKTPLTKREIKLQTKAGWLDDEADEKRPSETESSDGDIEPFKPDSHNCSFAKPKVIVSSDESDVETKAQRKIRRPMIVESSDSDEEKPIPAKRAPRAWQNTDESSSDEDMDKDLSDFVVSDEESQKKKQKEKTQVIHDSESESSEEERPGNRSILAELAPELMQDLRRDQVLSKADFKLIIKLFVMDNLNSKSLDNANGTRDGFSEEFTEFNQKVRRAINKMDNSLNESMSKCVTGAWNAIVRRRIDMHSTMSTVPAMNIWKCKVCNRRRKCSVMVSLVGYEYNRSSLRQNKHADYEITDEEIPFMEDVNGQQEYKNEDDDEETEEEKVPGVLFSVGPRCFFRMDLYHEARHYKAALYAEIQEEYAHQLENDDALQKAHWEAERDEHKPDRLVGADLFRVADLFVEKMEGYIDTSYAQYTGIGIRARDVDLQAGYIDEE